VLTKAQEFDRLAKTGNPADAFNAYKMTWKCLGDGFQSPCSELTAGQITMGYVLLEKAVAAHLPGAATHLLDIAPDGRQIGEVWDDPAYATWKQNAFREIAAAAERGDVKALGHMAELEFSYGTRERALTYWTAYADRKPMSDAALAQFTGRFLAGLTPEQIASATAAGHAIGRDQK
jgi:hypothetical protein